MTPLRIVLPSSLRLCATAALLVALTSCSSGDDGGDASGGPPQSAPSTPSDAEGAAEAAAGDEAPAGGVTFVDTVDDPDATITVTDAGFDPAETTVSVGAVVKFTAGADGTFGVAVNDLSSYTVTAGLDEYFRFEEPGTYKVTEEVSGNTAVVTAD